MQWFERLLACLIRTDEGAALVGQHREAPQVSYPAICPMDCDDPMAAWVLAAAATALKRKTSPAAISRGEIEDELHKVIAGQGEHKDQFLTCHGPNLYELLERLFCGKAPEIREFLFPSPTGVKRLRFGDRKVAAAVRSPLERWLAERRMEQIVQRFPDREHDDGFLEEIAELSLLKLGTRNAVVLFDSNTPPCKNEARLYLADAVVAKPGNLATFQALAKAGKSAFVEGLTASALGPSEGRDYLGWRSGNSEGHALLHFDTEQDREDHHELVSRALRRAGVSQPPWLRSYWIRELGIRDRLAYIRKAMAEAYADFGGVFLVLIDGVADLCANVNDPEESFALVHELLRLSSEYNTVLVNVLHENPGSEIGKTRGHLGSELERKSMSNLRLQKDAEGITTVWGEKMRKAEIPKAKGPRFRWDATAGMHLSVVARNPEEEAATKLRRLALDLFSGEAELTYDAAVEEIQVLEGVGERTAKTRFTELRKAGMVVQAGSKKGRPWKLGTKVVSPERAELAFDTLHTFGRPVELGAWLVSLPEEEHFIETELVLIAKDLVSAGRVVLHPGQGWSVPDAAGR